MLASQDSKETPGDHRQPFPSHVGKVRLAVSDLAASLAFYTEAIGLEVIEMSPSFAVLGAHGDQIPLLELEEQEGLTPLGRQTRLGMYHFAVLLPTRGDLGDFIVNAARKGIPFGSADHLVSEATYLVDPDGLTVEVYSDRPREQWPVSGSHIVMASDPLDFESLVAAGSGNWSGAPSGTTIGHMHFYVGDLEKAAQFYQDGLGLELRAEFPGALFMAANGYHHHVGANVWAARSRVASETDPRLLFWEWVLPDRESAEQIAQRMVSLGLTPESESVFRDPWGIAVHLKYL